MQNNNTNSHDIKELKFIDLWYDYEKFIKVKLKYQSYIKIKNRVKNHILQFFQDYKVIDINHYIYLDWMQEIDEKEFSYSYCTDLYNTMVNILNYAMKFYNLEKNIAHCVGNFSKKRIKKEIQYWTYEEFQKFINVVDDSLYKLFYELLYFTGLRQGECIALTWDDFKKDYISVNKTISKTKNDNNEYVINSPKTPSSIRNVYIDDSLKKSLNKLYHIEKKKEDFNNKWFIFGGKEPLSATTIGRRKNEYCKIANVKKIRIHDFRHSHATLLISQSVPITVISKRLGHSDIAMTLNVYSHAVPTDEEKAVTILNKLKSKA